MALVALAVLGVGIDRAEIAAPYSDPIALIRAQDEPVYVNAATSLASRGGWLTPKVQGRYLLYKPPLASWLPGLSAKVFGASPATLRLPSLVAAVAGTVLLFAWARAAGSTLAGTLAVLLLLSNPMWHTFARLCYTDMLFAASVIGALFVFRRDVKLVRPSSVAWFGFLTAAAVMTKNVAGLLPLLVLGLYWITSAEEEKPRLDRIAWVLGVIAIVAGPWHLYQAIAHPQWFWADYVQMQILGFGLHPPAQSSTETALWFYGRRLGLIDPFLLVSAAVAIPAIVVKRSIDARLLGCWLLMTVVALMAFRYRNLPYALYLVPPLALLGSLFAPFPRASTIILAGVFLVKSMAPGQPWALAFGASPSIEAAKHLRAYADRSRPRGLALVQADDELHSLTLPFRARYVFIDPEGIARRYAPHYVWLGVTLSVDEYLTLDRMRPEFRARLRSWGLDSDEPVATSILASTAGEIEHLIEASPGEDFYAPDSFCTAGAATHDVEPAGPGRCFLLTRRSAD